MLLNSLWFRQKFNHFKLCIKVSLSLCIMSQRQTQMLVPICMFSYATLNLLTLPYKWSLY